MAHLWVRDVALIDGLGGPALEHAHVLVDGERIESVTTRPPERVAEGVRVIDGAGLWALPGFIDAHVHLMAEGPDILGQMQLPAGYLYLRVPGRMRRTLDAGVTTVRDLGGLDGGVRRAVAEGLVAGPRLQTAVAVLSVTGGHGDFRPPPTAPAQTSMGLAVGLVGDGPEGVLRAVRTVIQAGADVIKVAATGGVLSPADDPRHSQFSPEELWAIAAEARRQGRRLAAHAQGAEGIKNAVRAGFTSIEHGIYLDDEAIDLMLAHGTVLVPTLVAPMAVLDAAAAGLPVPPWAVEKAKGVIEVHRESVRRAHAAGVRIALGTDSGVGAHGQNLRELALMAECGLTAMEAIVAGTRTAAELLGLEGELGTLEPGKRADVVLARVDPLRRLRDLGDPHSIAAVLQGGRVVKDRLTAGAAG